MTPRVGAMRFSELFAEAAMTLRLPELLPVPRSSRAEKLTERRRICAIFCSSACSAGGTVAGVVADAGGSDGAGGASTASAAGATPPAPSATKSSAHILFTFGPLDSIDRDVSSKEYRRRDGDWHPLPFPQPKR